MGDTERVGDQPISGKASKTANPPLHGWEKFGSTRRRRNRPPLATVACAYFL
jgi:hypothetical protein